MVYHAGTGVTTTEQPHSKGTRLKIPLVHTLDQVVTDLQVNPTDTLLVTPRWEHAAWFTKAKRLCCEYILLNPTSHHDSVSTQWAKTAFHFQCERTRNKHARRQGKTKLDRQDANRHNTRHIVKQPLKYHDGNDHARPRRMTDCANARGEPAPE